MSVDPKPKPEQNLDETLAKSKDELKKAVIPALVILALTPLTVFVTAKICEAGWDRFIAYQYGPGPTIRTWFGINFLLAVLLLPDEKKKDPEESWGAHAFSLIAGNMMYRLIMLVGAGWACVAWGWS